MNRLKNKSSRQLGEIATAITILSIVLMMVGMATGNLISKIGTRNTSKAAGHGEKKNQLKDCFHLELEADTDTEKSTTNGLFNLKVKIVNDRKDGQGGGVIQLSKNGQFMAQNGWDGKNTFVYENQWTGSPIKVPAGTTKKVTYAVKIDQCNTLGNYDTISAQLFADENGYPYSPDLKIAAPAPIVHTATPVRHPTTPIPTAIAGIGITGTIIINGVLGDHLTLYAKYTGESDDKYKIVKDNIAISSQQVTWVWNGAEKGKKYVLKTKMWLDAAATNGVWSNYVENVTPGSQNVSFEVTNTAAPNTPTPTTASAPVTGNKISGKVIVQGPKGEFSTIYRKYKGEDNDKRIEVQNYIQDVWEWNNAEKDKTYVFWATMWTNAKSLNGIVSNYVEVNTTTFPIENVTFLIDNSAAQTNTPTPSPTTAASSNKVTLKGKITINEPNINNKWIKLVACPISQETGHKNELKCNWNINFTRIQITSDKTINFSIDNVPYLNNQIGITVDPNYYDNIGNKKETHNVTVISECTGTNMDPGPQKLGKQDCIVNNLRPNDTITVNYSFGNTTTKPAAAATNTPTPISGIVKGSIKAVGNVDTTKYIKIFYCTSVSDDRSFGCSFELDNSFVIKSLKDIKTNPVTYSLPVPAGRRGVEMWWNYCDNENNDSCTGKADETHNLPKRALNCNEGYKGNTKEGHGIPYSDDPNKNLWASCIINIKEGETINLDYEIGDFSPTLTPSPTPKPGKAILSGTVKKVGSMANESYIAIEYVAPDIGYYPAVKIPLQAGVDTYPWSWDGANINQEYDIRAVLYNADTYTNISSYILKPTAPKDKVDFTIYADGKARVVIGNINVINLPENFDLYSNGGCDYCESVLVDESKMVKGNYSGFSYRQDSKNKVWPFADTLEFTNNIYPQFINTVLIVDKDYYGKTLGRGGKYPVALWIRGKTGDDNDGNDRADNKEACIKKAFNIDGRKYSPSSDAVFIPTLDIDFKDYLYWRDCDGFQPPIPAPPVKSTVSGNTNIDNYGFAAINNWYSGQSSAFEVSKSLQNSNIKKVTCDPAKGECLKLSL